MIKFDMEKSPPTIEQIDMERQNYTSILRSVEKRRKVMRLTGKLLIVIAIGATLALWFALDFEGYAFDKRVGVFFFSWIIGGLIALLVGASIWNKYISEPHAYASENLSRIAGIDPVVTPEACIEWDKMRQADNTIRIYSNLLVEIGRKPVMAEFSRARSWPATKTLRMAEKKNEHRAHEISNHGLEAFERMSKII